MHYCIKTAVIELYCSLERPKVLETCDRMHWPNFGDITFKSKTCLFKRYSLCVRLLSFCFLTVLLIWALYENAFKVLDRKNFFDTI